MKTPSESISCSSVLFQRMFRLIHTCTRRRLGGSEVKERNWRMPQYLSLLRCRSRMILLSSQLQPKGHIRSLQPLSKQSRIQRVSSSALPQTTELQARSNRHLPKCWIACSSVGVEVSVFVSDMIF